VPLLALMAIGPLARWKRLDERDIARRLRVPALVALAAGALLPFLMGHWSPLVAMGLMLAAWIVASGAMQVRERLRSGAPPLSFWGMQLAHLGVAVFVVGATLVKGYEIEKDVRMAVGDTVAIGNYTLRLVGLREVPGPNYAAQRGEIELSQDGHVLRSLAPEKRVYFSSQSPMTETAIDSGVTRDLYVSLGERLSGPGETTAWSVRVYYKPFVIWIWGGCLFMALGGGCAAADRRYRLRKAAALPQGAMA
jgi:cytochrome c-type biogenesis protein CcmF